MSPVKYQPSRIASAVVLVMLGGDPLPLDGGHHASWSTVERLAAASVVGVDLALLSVVVVLLTRHHPGRLLTRALVFFDNRVVDGLVNAVARVIQEASFTFRRLQTGLVQNYALLMLFGVFAFVTVYLFAR